MKTHIITHTDKEGNTTSAAKVAIYTGEGDVEGREARVKVRGGTGNLLFVSCQTFISQEDISTHRPSFNDRISSHSRNTVHMYHKK